MHNMHKLHVIDRHFAQMAKKHARDIPFGIRCKKISTRYSKNNASFNLWGTSCFV